MGLLGQLLKRGFVRSEPTGLIEPEQINLQDYVGATIVPMPWDATQRGQNVTKIAGFNKTGQPMDVNTTGSGGDRFMDDEYNIKKGVIGASAKEINKRIQKRARDAATYGISQPGGTGEVILATNTMGNLAEGFSGAPSETLSQLVNQGFKKDIKTFNKDLKNLTASTLGLGIKTSTGELKYGKFPFKNFPGVSDPDFPAMLRGEIKLKAPNGKEITPGDFRKAFYNRATNKGYQKLFNFDFDSFRGSQLDDTSGLLGRGMMGNRMGLITSGDQIKVVPNTDNLTKNIYESGITGKRLGTLDLGAQPIEKLMPNAYGKAYAMLKQTYPNMSEAQIRAMAIGKMEKSKDPSIFSQVITDEVLENIYKGLL